MWKLSVWHFSSLPCNHQWPSMFQITRRGQDQRIWRIKGSSLTVLVLNVKNRDRDIIIKASKGTDATGLPFAGQVQVYFCSLPLNKHLLTPPVAQALLVDAGHTHIREQAQSLPPKFIVWSRKSTDELQGVLGNALNYMQNSVYKSTMYINWEGSGESQILKWLSGSKKY